MSQREPFSFELPTIYNSIYNLMHWISHLHLKSPSICIPFRITAKTQVTFSHCSAQSCRIITCFGQGGNVSYFGLSTSFLNMTVFQNSLLAVPLSSLSISIEYHIWKRHLKAVLLKSIHSSFESTDSESLWNPECFHLHFVSHHLLIFGWRHLE